MNDAHQLKRLTLWNRIQAELGLNKDTDFLTSLKTNKGNTQSSERSLIGYIRDRLTEMSLSFEEAPSQQSKDFRNVGGIGLDIEVKKTDSYNVIFNDTCPNADIHYIIVFTGKEYKTKQSIPPAVLYVNGSTFIDDSPWILEYTAAIEKLRDEFARGKGRQSLPGRMSVYPRPTYTASIKDLLPRLE